MAFKHCLVSWYVVLNTLVIQHATLAPGQAVYERGVRRCLTDNKIFDQEQGRCVSKVGHPCIYTWVHQTTTTDHNYMEHPDCVKNAFCSTEGLCVCKTQFYDTSNGTCIPSAKYMEPCHSETRCSIPLKCKNGLCQCEKDDQPCLGLAGEDCVNSTLCTSHATCSSQTNTCVCDDGFYADRTSGQCLPKVGRMGDCKEDFQCTNNQPGKNFVCTDDGHCNCDPKSSVFENVTIPMDTKRWAWGNDMTMSTIERCVGKAGHPCVDGFCTARGFCTALSDRTLRPICACLPGTLATDSGHCLFAHGEQCESPQDCINELTCKNNECSCIYADQIYEEQIHKCFSKAGGPCGASPSTSSYLECIRTAKCWPIDSEKEEGSGPGHCVCQNGYVETVEGDCAASYNAECDSKASCLSNLVCRDNKCQCDHFALFNERERKCMALVGASCGMPKDDECVDHSYCKQSHPKFRGHCECQPGYFETSNYTCTRIQYFFSANEVYNVL